MGRRLANFRPRTFFALFEIRKIFTKTVIISVIKKTIGSGKCLKSFIKKVKLKGSKAQAY